MISGTKIQNSPGSPIRKLRFRLSFRPPFTILDKIGGGSEYSNQKTAFSFAFSLAFHYL